MTEKLTDAEIRKLKACTSDECTCTVCRLTLRALAEIEEMRKDIARYIATFKHVHVAQDGTDSCKACGLDLRDEIHVRCNCGHPVKVEEKK